MSAKRLIPICLGVLIILVIDFNGVSCSSQFCTISGDVPNENCIVTQASSYKEEYGRPCGWWNWWRCTSYRTRYSMAYKTENTPNNFVCCPGWENMENNRCTTPTCNPCCENGGSCISKDRCSCPPNFSGPTCSNDVNECLTNNGGCAHECINSVGSYNCVCRPGYQLASNGRNCNDINECTESNAGCDHICQNTPGSFICRCRDGFTLDEDGRTCNEKDYCDETDCEENCVSVSGRGVCYCDPGYYLAADGKSCVDVNECNSNDTNVCEHSCVNTPGSYSCICGEGYTVGDDGVTCIDVNECIVQNGDCDHNCVNTIGSYHCTCNEYFKLAEDGKTCYQ